MLYNLERLLALMDKFDLAGVVAATPEYLLPERSCFLESKRIPLWRFASLCCLST